MSARKYSSDQKEAAAEFLTKHFPVRKRSVKDDRGLVALKKTKLTPIEANSPPQSPTATSPFLTPLPLRKQSIVLGLGNFSLLPNCLLSTFIETAHVSCLTTLCLSSHEWKRRVLTFMKSKTGYRIMLERCAGSVEAQELRYTHNDYYHLYGNLLKALTVGKEEGERLRIFFSICRPFFDSPHVSGLGRTIRTFCYGLPDSLSVRMVNVVMSMKSGELKRGLNKLMENEVGTQPQLEMQIRKNLHSLFVDSAVGTEERAVEDAFWLSALLASRKSIQEQARLLMLLFAPLTTHDEINGEQVRVNWRSLCDHVVTAWEDGVARVKPVADAIERLSMAQQVHSQRLHWSKLMLFNLIEETTTFPEPWAFDNFVFLLLLKPKLSPLCLAARMMHGFTEEAGQIINAMKLLVHRWQMSMHDVLKLPLYATLQQLTPLEQRSFFCTILNAHHKLAADYINQGAAGQLDFAAEMASFGELATVISDLNANI